MQDNNPDQTMYPLRNSFIFDTGADTHIINDKDRFVGPLKEYATQRNVYVGDNYVDIVGYGDAHIYITDPSTDTQVQVTLKNAAYIPSFHTNIVLGTWPPKTTFSWISREWNSIAETQ